MQVRDIMTDRVITVSQLEPISSAAKLMKRHNLGALPVCDDEGRLRGVITDRDIVTRCVAADMEPSDTRIRDIMSRGIPTCRADEDINDALHTMGREQVRRLPVTQDGRLVGMVSLADLSRSAGSFMEAAEALSEISANILRK